MELLKESRSCSWYLVKEFTTEAGLAARVHKCVWNRDLMPDLSLHDHHTGYVQLPEGKTLSEQESEALEVHGGITFSEGSFKNIDEKVEGRWIGFDMAHLGDENIPEPLAYCVLQCEVLAKQLV